MKAHSSMAGWCIIVLVLMLVGAQVAMCANCDPVNLSACAGAIMSSAPPSAECCAKMKQEKPCLCQYMKDPSLQKFVNTPNAKKVADTCGTPFPTC